MWLSKKNILKGNVMAVKFIRPNIAYDIHEKLVELAPSPINADRDPTAADRAQLNTLWNNNATGEVFILSQIVNGASVWSNIAGGALVIVNLTVNGVTTLNGRVDMNGTPINISANAAAAAVNIATGAAVKTLTMGSVNGASISTLQSGTGGIAINSHNGVMDLISGTGALSISDDAANTTVSISSGAAVKLLTVGSNFGASSSDIQSGTGGLFLSSNNGVWEATSGTGAVSISSDVANTTVGIANGAAVKLLTIGSNFGASATTIQAAGGNMSINSNNGTMDLISGTGALSISDDAAATAVNIATGGAVKTMVLGSTNGASISTLQSGTGGITVNSHNGVMDIISGTGALSISDDAAATTLSIGTGAAVKLTTLGSTNGASSTTVQAGTAGISLASAGLMTSAFGTDTQASPANNAAIATNVGYALFTGFVTAAAATQDFIITNANLTATSKMLVTICNEGANDAQMQITRITRGAGSVTISTKNQGAAALNGDVGISFWVFSY